MTLPSDFISLMHAHLGPEQAEALFAGLEEEPVTSIRLNTRKLAKLRAEGIDVDAPFAELLSESEPVPWCPDAFYLPTRPNFTLDPLFHAGAYYVQEASSMYLAEMLRQYAPLSRPLCALDLCAAPGGKSTLLRSLLSDDSLLVSNEPMPKRAQILAENIVKWGHPASVVTRNFPADFAPFVDCFDLLVTDVPCSGEGMFRKDKGAIRDWSLENVKTCWRRQRDILTDIWPTLRPGGLLIYSTCTFNRFEDEDNVKWIASSLGATILAQRHFFPGRDRGEGFFIAALRKNTPDSLSPTPSPRERADWTPLMKKLQRGLHCLVCGVEEKEMGKKDWQPTHAYALSLCYRRDYPEYALTRDEAIAYLRHEALRIDAPRGYVLVTYCGFPLGFVKSVGNRANNLYPQEWRIRTTYTS